MVAPASNDDDDDDTTHTAKDEDVIDRLLVGYKRFRREKLTKRLDSKLKTLSQEGQRGCKVLCVSCCDSRYDPTLVFNADPGEIFTVRNVANVIPRFVKHEDKKAETAHHGTCAAIEYAVKSLKVEAIVVLGHAQCGGCAHALSLFSEPEEAKVEKKDDVDDDDDDDGSGYVDAWCGLLKESVKRVCSEYDKDERLRQLEHENVRQSVENVKTFPFVRDRIAKGELKVRGGFFTIFSGGLCVMDEETKVFERIKDDYEHILESEDEKAASKAAPEVGGEKDDENVAPPPRSVIDDNKSNKRQKKK